MAMLSQLGDELDENAFDDLLDIDDGGSSEAFEAGRKSTQPASVPFKDAGTRPPAILEDQPESSEADSKVPEQVSESSKPKVELPSILSPSLFSQKYLPFRSKKKDEVGHAPAAAQQAGAVQHASVDSSTAPARQQGEAEKTFLVGSKEWFESMKETRQDISSADASGGSKDVSKNVSSFEVLKRELDAPKPTANKAPLHENKASDLLEKERLNANKSTNAPRIISYNQMRENVMGQVAASHTSRRADEIKKTIIRREVKEVEREGALVGVQNVRAREAEAEEGREGEEEDQEGEREGEEAGAEKEEERKLFRGELSGNVLSDNEARLVGSSPTPGQCQMVVFSFGVDYKITFDAGDLVLVPRSKGGLCFGVLESRKTDAKKRVFWNVELGAGAVKPVPEPMLGKSLSGICAKRSEEINNIRAIGKEPTQEDLRSVIFGLSSKFDKLEVVLVPCARGGFAYGYIADCDGNHHYLVKSSIRESENSRRLPCYGVGKLKLQPREQQSILGPVLSRGIEVKKTSSFPSSSSSSSSKDHRLGQTSQETNASVKMNVSVLSREQPADSRKGQHGAEQKESFDAPQVVFRSDSPAHVQSSGNPAKSRGEIPDSEREWLENFLSSEEGKVWLDTDEGRRWRMSAEGVQFFKG